MRHFECVDCSAAIVAGDRGPFPKRCPDCNSKRKRQQQIDTAIARKARGHVSKKQAERTATAEAKAEVEARRAASQALGCRICGAALSGMQLLYCCRKCAWTAELNRNRPTFTAIPCAECATSFVPKSSQGKYCSRKCLHKARDRIYVTRRHLRVKAGEKIDPVKVFERDGWRCRNAKRGRRPNCGALRTIARRRWITSRAFGMAASTSIRTSSAFAGSAMRRKAGRAAARCGWAWRAPADRRGSALATPFSYSAFPSTSNSFHSGKGCRPQIHQTELAPASKRIQSRLAISGYAVRPNSPYRFGLP